MKAWLALAILLVSVAGCGADPRPGVPPPASADAPPASEGQADVVASTPASAASSAASSPSVASPSAPPQVSTADALKLYIAESSAAWASREFGRHTSLYTSDADIAIGGLEDEHVTPSDLEARFARETNDTQDLQLRFARGIAGNGRAVTEWVLSGSFVPAGTTTTKQIGCRGASVLTFAADGRVTHEIRFCTLGQLDPLPASAMPKAGDPPELLVAKDSDSDGVAREWLRALDVADAKTLLELASEDFMLLEGKGGGRKELEGTVRKRVKTFTNATSTVSMCIPTERAIACLFDWHATWSGPLAGLKANGKAGSVRTLEVLTLTNGKISRSHRYFDGDLFFKAFSIGDDPLFWLKMKGNE